LAPTQTLTNQSISSHSHRIKRENEKTPDDRPTKRRRLARGVQGVHALDMSLVTPENASSRPGWHVTPTGRILHPMRMRPQKPLPPVSGVTSNRAGNKDGKKKRKREKPKLVRARRRAIDPTKWNSQHLKGAFLDSVVVAGDGDDLPVITPSQPYTSGDQEGSDPSSGEEEGDESDSSEPEPVVKGSTTSESIDGPPCIVHEKLDAIDIEHDFNQERLRTLSLLDSMFGSLEGDQEWSVKALDSDVDTPEPPPARTSPSTKSSPQREAVRGPDSTPDSEEARGDSGNEGSSAGVATPAPERAPTSVTTRNANTKAKLKDLFAPQEEQGARFLTYYLSKI